MPNGYGGPFASPEHERIHDLEAERDRAELRIRQLAILFLIPDGAQYLNDAIARAAALRGVTEAELRDILKGLELE